MQRSPEAFRSEPHKMSKFPASSPKEVLRALQRIGWREKLRISKSGSHKQLQHPDFPHEFTWAFHDAEEIGPVVLAKIAKKTGLKPEDL
jgi:predicted RNA binding protein YcfA (HicA-like mRNA interferase family)